MGNRLSMNSLTDRTSSPDIANALETAATSRAIVEVANVLSAHLTNCC